MSLKKYGITSKDEEVVGSFAPTVTPHIIQMSPEVVPTGFFSRGTCAGKAMLIDLDGIVHIQYEFAFRISKEW